MRFERNEFKKREVIEEIKASPERPTTTIT
jgi:hypothetical protein